MATLAAKTPFANRIPPPFPPRYPIFRMRNSIHGIQRRFFDCRSINGLPETLVSHPRTRRTIAITMPNVKAYSSLAQLCNVPRARQRIVSVPYLAWDSPRLWPASGDAKLWTRRIGQFYWISCRKDRNYASMWRSWTCFFFFFFLFSLS